MNTYTGGCFCSGVQWKFEQKITNSVCCHCSICKHIHSSSYLNETIVGINNFQITKGKELLSHYPTSEGCDRYFCSKCGTHLYNHIHNFGVGVLIQTFDVVNKEKKLLEELKPTIHIFYKDRSHDMKDGVIKFEGFGRNVNPNAVEMKE
eukprot:gene10495-3016_t